MILLNLLKLLRLETIFGTFRLRTWTKQSNTNIDNYDGFYHPTVDHKVARSMGGKDEISNYVIVCRKANQFKSDMGSKEELDAFYKGMVDIYYS